MSELLRVVVRATLATLAVSAVVWVALLVPGLKALVYIALMLPLLWVAAAGIDVGGSVNGFLDINALGYGLWIAALWVVCLVWALASNHRRVDALHDR